MEDVNESIKNKKEFEVEEHISNLNESNQVLNENLEPVTKPTIIFDDKFLKFWFFSQFISQKIKNLRNL